MNTEKKIFFNKRNHFNVEKQKNDNLDIESKYEHDDVVVSSLWTGHTTVCCDVLIMAALFTMTQAQKRGIQVFVNLNIILIWCSF